MAFRIAQARWTPAAVRLAHAGIAFVPVLIVTAILLLAAACFWAPWILHPAAGRSAWLNWPAFAVRDFLSLLALWALFFLFVRWSLKSDEKVRLDPADHSRLNAIAVVAAVVFAISESIIAWDLIMSLSPRWVSTMFAPYYFTSNMYAGIAVLIVLAARMRKPPAAEPYLQPAQFKDLGNLMLGFSLFLMGLFYAQYVTIWYENLPQETGFLITRYLRGPWPYIGWAAFIIEYGVPFLLLQSRYVKTHPRLLWPVAMLGLAGFALERYVLIFPSIFPHRVIACPAAALTVLAAAGLFALSVTAFLRRYPAVSKADQELRGIYEEIEKVETY